MTDQTKDDIRLLRGWAADNHNCHRGIFARAADAMEDRAALETAVHILRNLLAVIHRDGGHYADQHGLEKAAKDAEKAWAEREAEIAKLKVQNEGLKEAAGIWERNSEDACQLWELLYEVYSQAGNHAPPTRRHALTGDLRDRIRDVLHTKKKPEDQITVIRAEQPKLWTLP